MGWIRETARRILAVWRGALASPGFRIEFLVSVVLLLAVLTVFAAYLGWVESREGAVLEDPLLRLYEPVDVTAATFVIIYAALITALVMLVPRPRRFARALQAYCVMLSLRGLSMYLMPLDPPPTMIPLLDPIVGYFGAVDTPTRDLFFSGHTSTMFLIALAAPSAWFRSLALVATVGVGACVLAQHVHYTIDVFVAPFMAWASWRLVGVHRLPLRVGPTPS